MHSRFSMYAQRFAGRPQIWRALRLMHVSDASCLSSYVAHWKKAGADKTRRSKQGAGALTLDPAIIFLPIARGRASLLTALRASSYLMRRGWKGMEG